MKALDRLIELLPVPALIAVGAMFASAWLVKLFRAYSDYAPVFADKYFQSAAAVSIAGLVLFFLLSRTDPFPANERGVVVAAFEGDATGSVRRHTMETLRSRTRSDPSLADVKVIELDGPLTDDGAAQVMASRRPVAIIAGSVVSGQLVWYRMYWGEKLPPIQMSVSNFPTIDQFTDRFFSTLVPRRSADIAPRDLAEARFKNSKKFAVVIGNSHYTKLGPLLGVEQDVAIVSKVLTQMGVIVRLVRNGTRDNILSTLKNVFIEASGEKHALIYVYYSGHGATDTASIVPADFSGTGFINVSEIVEFENLANNADIFLFLDSHIGSLAEVNSERVSILAAGQTGELIADTRSGGIFTAELVKQLSELTGTDGYIYFDQLAQAVSRGVVAATENKNRPLSLSFSPRIVAASRVPTTMPR